MLKEFIPYRPELAKLYKKRGYWTENTFTDEFDRMARRFWNKEALVGGDQRYTYGELKIKSDRLAMHFLHMGLKKEDRVVIQLPNIPEFLVIYLAMQKIGVIPVMCLQQHRYTEISYLAKKAGAIGYVVAGIFRDYDYKELVEQVKADMPEMKFCMIAGLGEECPKGYYSIHDMMDDPIEERMSPEILELAHPDPDDICILLLSGGTTGMNKLIPREYNAYRYVGYESSWECALTMYTRYLCVAPVAHNFVLNAPGIQGCLMFGGTVVMGTSTKIEDICALIEKEKVTHVPMVPAMVIKLLDFEDRDKYDLSSLEIIINGASKLEYNAAIRVVPELKCKLISQFGMSEGTITQTSLLDTWEVNYTTIGLPVSPDDEYKFMAIDGSGEVPFGEDGEIWFRGPYTIRGYWDEPEKNKEAFSDNGFYKSGDIGRMHLSGRGIIISGRIKDLINRGGEKFACSEVENLLLKHPKVHNCALVAMPDKILGEKGCMFVSLNKKDDTLTLEEVCEYLGDKLARFKLPERLETRDELIETNVGKIEKKYLRAEILEIMKAEGKI
ncbi:MAG: AMP-binding protein [Dehalobacterium sp.]